MSSLYKRFKTDEKAETEGVLLDYGTAGRFRIARAGGSNRDYVKAIEKMNRKYRRQIQLETLEDAVATRVLQEIYADTIVLGWEGVSDAEGKPLDFTRENCLKLFEDLPDFFRDIVLHAMKVEVFREAALEEDTKNS